MIDLILSWKRSACVCLFHRGQCTLRISPDRALPVCAYQQHSGHCTKTGSIRLWWNWFFCPWRQLHGPVVNLIIKQYLCQHIIFGIRSGWFIDNIIIYLLNFVLAGLAARSDQICAISNLQKTWLFHRAYPWKDRTKDAKGTAIYGR